MTSRLRVAFSAGLQQQNWSTEPLHIAHAFACTQAFSYEMTDRADWLEKTIGPLKRELERAYDEVIAEKDKEVKKSK
jgi:hypothetical protein